jgi:hypothetical protein
MKVVSAASRIALLVSGLRVRTNSGSNIRESSGRADFRPRYLCVYLRALGLGSAFAQGSTGDSVNRTVQEKMKNSEEPSSPQMRSEKNRKQNHGSRSLEFSCGPDKQPNFADNASALQASRRPKDCHLVTRSVPFFHCCLPISCSLLARAAPREFNCSSR